MVVPRAIPVVRVLVGVVLRALVGVVAVGAPPSSADIFLNFLFTLTGFSIVRYELRNSG